jgi:hypothetical protein
MNERFKEIEKQCWQSSQSEPYALFDVKKFAELIVLKCAKIADTAEPFLASDLIKQHFGVEE